MGLTTTSPLDRPDVRQYIEEIVNVDEDEKANLSDLADHISDVYGIPTTRHSIRRALRRWSDGDAVDGSAYESPEETPGVSVSTDKAKVVSRAEPAGLVTDPDSLIRERGLDPDDWDVVPGGLIVKEWDAMTSDKATGDNRIVRMRQIILRLARKRPFNFVYPAEEGPSYRNTVRKPPISSSRPRLVIFTGDQQAPYTDMHLHSLFCEFLEEQKPEEGVLIGDTIDLPDVSRHRDNPEWHVPAQECVNAGYLILRDYVQSSEGTRWKKLVGNHDERIRNRLLDHHTRVDSLRPADIPGQPQDDSVFSIANLLRLDSLGIELIEPNGGYTHAQAKVSPFLAARHGWIARKGSGASALATLEALGYSIVVGHTHRQSLVHKTTHSIDGKPFTLAAAETGCMCRIEQGLGYAVAPDWQNGFATATVWPDGTFRLDLATYVDGSLYWRDKRYS